MPFNASTGHWQHPTIVTCDHCNETSDETRTITTTYLRGTNRVRNWCDDCISNYAFFCNDCEDYFSLSLASAENSSGDIVCSSCGENYFRCDGCDRVRCQDDYAQDGYCSSCAESETSVIQEYSSDVNTRPLGKGRHFYGVELEVEKRSGYDLSEQAEKAQDLLNTQHDGEQFAILKSDGSLNCGFEIVTRPATLDEQRQRWTKFFDDRPRGLVSFKTDTCGLHVHCSRAPLTDLTIAKIVCFTNSAQNRRFMSVIAGRPSGHWSAYKTKKLSEAYKRNSDRYEAVNLQNRATIEFRIFKGTLKRESVYKAIEFCDCLMRFCLPAERSLRDAMLRGEFCNYAQSNVKTYPHLVAFIDAKWYGRETKATIKYGFAVAQSDNEQAAQLEEI